MKPFLFKNLLFLCCLCFFLPSKSYSQSFELSVGIENFLFKPGNNYRPSTGVRLHLQPKDVLESESMWVGAELGFFIHKPTTDKVEGDNYSIEYLNNLLHFPLALSLGKHYTKNDKLFCFWQSGLSYNYIFKGNVLIKTSSSNSETGYSDTRFGPHLGGGFTYKINSSIALNSQVRYSILWTPPASTTTSSGGIVPATESGDVAGDFLNTLTFDFGIKVFIGKE